MNNMWNRTANADALEPPKRRPRLAIVSTYNELCGIAGYTRALERQLAGSFAVTVMNLDQYLLRSPHAAVQKLADAHIAEICAHLGDFECVNIQLEHGTLGLTAKQILRRFRRLSGAAASLSVTFHTILPAERIDRLTLLKSVATLRWAAAISTVASHGRATRLSNGIYRRLRKLQRSRPVHSIVHTRRDMRLLHDVFKLRHVLHHPLCFVMPEERAKVRGSVSRSQFPLLRSLPPGVKLVGVFGFISEYKGFDTVIRALRLLPPEQHLLIFGGVHPQTIRKRLAIDPYLQKLLDTGYVGRTVFDEFAGHGQGSSSVQVSLDGSSTALLEGHPKDLTGRIHFMGALSDSEFVSAMAVCDAVVLSYLEVGQSSSGPISQALEMGCRVIASRTNTFLQYAKYHPDQFEFFDIGNHLELAERLAAESPIDCSARRLAYDWSTNAAVYARASGFEHSLETGIGS